MIATKVEYDAATMEDALAQLRLEWAQLQLERAQADFRTDSISTITLAKRISHNTLHKISRSLQQYCHGIIVRHDTLCIEILSVAYFILESCREWS